MITILDLNVISDMLDQRHAIQNSMFFLQNNMCKVNAKLTCYKFIRFFSFQSLCMQ